MHLSEDEATEVRNRLLESAERHGLGSEAEDAVHEAFLKILPKPSKNIRSKVGFAIWLGRKLVWVYAQEYRKRPRPKSLEAYSEI